MKSRFRTWKKEEADFFFVPSYVKCVRMMGGLTDKEINQSYVKVVLFIVSCYFLGDLNLTFLFCDMALCSDSWMKILSQMPYFRLSGGRNHIFVFPRYMFFFFFFFF